jgi:TRAP-type uncharacterized transport system fused permease subunit
VAPSLLESGVEPIIGHFSVFSFAIDSNITPPIALSVVIAQGIADSGYMETAFEALKIGFPMFVLPYAFVYNPSLLMLEPMTLVAFAIVLVGLLAMSAGLAGQLTQPISLPIRVALFVLGAVAIFAPLMAQAVLVIALLAGMTYFSRSSLGARPVAE